MAEASVRLHQISLGEFVNAAAGEPRFRAKHMPIQTLRRDLHTDASRLIGLFFLTDDVDTFILGSRWIGGEVWSPELDDYTDPVWETVVLRSTAEAFATIPTGPDSTCRLEWPEGVVQWSGVVVEPFAYHGEPVIFGVGGALAYTVSHDGRPYEFLIGLELPSPTGRWDLKQSASPNAFVLARQTLT